MFDDRGDHRLPSVGQKDPVRCTNELSRQRGPIEAPTWLFDATVSLVADLTSKYSIDSSRPYATVQSMAAMMTIGLNVRHPELFAAS
jgi:hypothetical protein